MLNSFLTITKPVSAEIVEKKSKFIAQIIPIESEEDAFAKLEAIKKENRDARHNVFSYRIANGPERASDDGEPSRNSRSTNFRYIKRFKITKCFGGCYKIFWRNFASVQGAW